MCRQSGNKPHATQALLACFPMRARNPSARRRAPAATDTAFTTFTALSASPLQALDIPSLTVILPVRELPASAPEQRHPEGSETNERGHGQTRRQKRPALPRPAVEDPAHIPAPAGDAPAGHIDIRATPSHKASPCNR